LCHFRIFGSPSLSLGFTSTVWRLTLLVAALLVGLCAVGLIAGLAWMDYLDEEDHRRWMTRQRRRQHRGGS